MFGIIVVPLDDTHADLVRAVLAKHGPEHRISYRNTGCGWEGGAYVDANGPYLSHTAPSGLTRNPLSPFLHVGNGAIWLRDYPNLKPEALQELSQALKKGGIELKIKPRESTS